MGPTAADDLSSCTRSEQERATWVGSRNRDVDAVVAQSMRAAIYDSYATDNSTLHVADAPDPKVGPGTVLIEVRAAGVNPVDWKVLAGYLDGMLDATFPVIPGWDVAGVVAAVGPDTPEFAVGDEVFAYARKDVVHGGTFAEKVAVPATSVAAKPSALTWEQAAGLPLAGLTALRSLERVGISEGSQGRTVLVLGVRRRRQRRRAGRRRLRRARDRDGVTRQSRLPAVARGRARRLRRGRDRAHP